MAKRQNFVVGSTNPVTATKTQAQLNNGWNKYEVLKAGDLDGVFNAVSDYSNDSSQEIWNAIRILKGSNPTGASTSELGNIISTVLGAKATKATDFMTPLTSNNKGATAADLNTLREEIETSSLTFKGYVATSAPSSSTYGLVEGNIWINASAMPTTFPVAIAGVWNGTSWATTTDTYTVKDFDFFRNINDGEGYYWFGGQWVVMSTDMSTTYFTLNQTSGKWEIKSSVNLPGSPTTTTPTSSSPDNQIATKKYVDEAIAPLPTNTYFPDLFDYKWADYICDDASWLLADTFSWQSGAVYQAAYQHLVDDVDNIQKTTLHRWRRYTTYYMYVYTLSATPAVGDAIYQKPYDAYYQTDHIVESVPDSTHISMQPDGSFAYAYDGPVEATVAQRETVDGTTIVYYQADDGHKICPASQESNVLAIYNATGVAWYYILDTENQRFKLPRVNPDKEQLLSSAPVLAQVNSATYNSKQVISHNISGSVVATGYALGNNGSGFATPTSYNEYTDLSNGTGSFSGKKHLYFYVGNFTQTALENTAGLNAELFNEKMDTDAGNATSAAKNTVVRWMLPDYSAGVSVANITTSTPYTAPADGFLYGDIYNCTVYVNGSQVGYSDNTSYSCVMMIVLSQGDIVTVNQQRFGRVNFYPCKK